MPKLAMFVATATTSSRNDQREPAPGIEPLVWLSSPDQEPAVLTAFVIVETNDCDSTRYKHHHMQIWEVCQSCRNEYGKASRNQGHHSQLCYHVSFFMAGLGLVDR